MTNHGSINNTGGSNARPTRGNSRSARIADTNGNVTRVNTRRSRSRSRSNSRSRSRSRSHSSPHSSNYGTPRQSSSHSRTRFSLGSDDEIDLTRPLPNGSDIFQLLTQFENTDLDQFLTIYDKAGTERTSAAITQAIKDICLEKEFTRENTTYENNSIRQAARKKLNVSEGGKTRRRKHYKRKYSNKKRK
jgi:hypothetical protein